MALGAAAFPAAAHRAAARRAAPPAPGRLLAGAAALLALTMTSCTGHPTAAARTAAAAPPSSPASVTDPATTAAAPVPAPVSSPTSRSAAEVAAAAAPTVTGVTAAELGASWHPGCPVGPDQLRALRVPYLGFDGRAHTGVLVANRDAVGALTAVFDELYRARFPIRSVRPVADFGGSDDASAAADNTSGFNCRTAVGGSPSWSEHAYGEAVDVNDVENPYLTGGRVIPPAGAAFADRSARRPGMVEGTGVDAFARHGWSWGGRWSSPDYQHFSVNGR